VTYLNGALAVFAASVVSEPVQQVQNQVVTFATLFVQESQSQTQADEKKKDKTGDIVVTDTSCTPK
jgi:hypothetical protein